MTLTVAEFSFFNNFHLQKNNMPEKKKYHENSEYDEYPSPRPSLPHEKGHKNIDFSNIVKITQKLFMTVFFAEVFLFQVYKIENRHFAGRNHHKSARCYFLRN